DQAVDLSGCGDREVERLAGIDPSNHDCCKIDADIELVTRRVLEFRAGHVEYGPDRARRQDLDLGRMRRRDLEESCNQTKADCRVGSPTYFHGALDDKAKSGATDRANQSTCRLSALTIGAHRPISDWMTLVSSWGGPPSAAPARRSSAAFISLLCSATLTAPLSLAITSGGVPAGAKRPVQALVEKSRKPLSIMVGPAGRRGLR